MGNRIISPENQNFYNVSVTLHGFIMIFFLVMPGLFGGFGNYFVPIFQGSPEVVYPRVNNFYNVMPRRIPDFPDSFHSWNFLSSIGSGITFLSFAIFIPDPIRKFLHLLMLEQNAGETKQ